jgi:enoyl-CoA hydratase
LIEGKTFILKESHSLAHMILNRPPKNEIDMEFFHELKKARQTVFPHLKVKGMIIYGKGNHFSSGTNIEELKSSIAKNDNFNLSVLKENVSSLLFFKKLPFPVIAAINGCCLGVGFELALACDYRIASPRAVFCFPEITFGLIPGCGGSIQLPKLAGRGKAVEMILSGKSMLADIAKSIGLVDHITEKKYIIGAAEKLIMHLSENYCYEDTAH